MDKREVGVGGSGRYHPAERKRFQKHRTLKQYDRAQGTRNCPSPWAGLQEGGRVLGDEQRKREAGSRRSLCPNIFKWCLYLTLRFLLDP